MKRRNPSVASMIQIQARMNSRERGRGHQAPSFLEAAAGANAHKEKEMLCCNICREEYKNEMKYPDMLKYEAGIPPGPNPFADDASLLETGAGAGTGTGEGEGESSEETTEEVTEEEQQLADSGIIVGRIKEKDAPEPLMQASENGEEGAEEEVPADPKLAKEHMEQQHKINTKLAPCCNLCPTGCDSILDDSEESSEEATNEEESTEVAPGKQPEIPQPDPPTVHDPRPCCKRTTSITYRVVLGDWLSKIARVYCTTWQQIHRENPFIKNANLIYPGQLITIPPPNCRRSSFSGLYEPRQPVNFNAQQLPPETVARVEQQISEDDQAGDEEFVELDATRRRVGFVSKLKSAAKKVVSKVKKVASKVVNVAKKVVHHVKKAVKKVAHHVKTAAKKVAHHVASAVHHVAKKVHHIAVHHVPVLGQMIGGIAKSVMDAAKKFMTPEPRIPRHVPVPNMPFFPDKGNPSVAFDPPGAERKPENRCTASKFKGCCTICYTTWPGEHPRQEMAFRHERNRERQKIDEANKPTINLPERKEYDDPVNRLDYLQAPQLLHDGEQPNGFDAHDVPLHASSLPSILDEGSMDLLASKETSSPVAAVGDETSQTE